ncbi:MAG: M28 family peptidase [Gemmatimonadota bacterium]
MFRREAMSATRPVEGRAGVCGRSAVTVVSAVVLWIAAGAGALRGQERESASRSHPETCPSARQLVGDASEPLAAVRYLADDALEGRLAGSRGARCAAAYIAGEFRRLGLVPAGEEGGYFQSVPLASAVNPHGPGGAGRNVIGRLPGSGTARKAEVVVVGAHYDHLGRGGFGSVNPKDVGQIHNGADDNASGVGTLLAIAERLAARPALARSVLFIAFTGEELGLLGSAYYVQHPTVPLGATVAMVNLDMVGRLDSKPLIVNGAGTTAEWKALVSSADESVGLELAFGPSGYGPSDQTSFYSADIPVLHFFTNVHGDYHRPTDDWEKVDVPGMEKVADLVAGVIVRVAERPERLALVRGVGQPPSSGSEEGYGAYLGTIPDFAPVENGVRISGVGPESPAERAGLEAGDVIVGLAEYEVGDLYDMTRALRAHKPGDVVQVTVMRDGRRLTFRAVLGDRATRSSKR